MCQILPRNSKNPTRNFYKDFRTQRKRQVVSIHLSSCDTFLNIPIEKWAETEDNLMNSDAGCPECQWFQSILLLPIYIFHMGPWTANRSQPVPLYPTMLPPWGRSRSEVKEILIPQHSAPRAPKHKPNSFHDASVWANLGSFPLRSASILNGNYCTHQQTYTHKWAYTPPGL